MADLNRWPFNRYGLPSSLDIHTPVLTSSSRSIPVENPRPSNKYTTSSVATFPLAPLAYGQPPSPATDESTTLTPMLTDAYIFAIAWPYVSWKCTAN
ncbi:hypothetical protein AX774_g2163 [Zancudomyces culisetae]|uniref:Uncharacterized protein n=1 Tax=Zancudomyces culisetae TaxID=1213189 RepID=A0A1R1PTJ8_ZANCU|nr:hypothetical protein AX774_g2163 [Zancudomyces culisetae]|eukprot:OMH84315.1 hypothetical protein AX774_g2163 [Zancudomyces culisetae]